jgi:hypothetical protein
MITIILKRMEYVGNMSLLYFNFGKNLVPQFSVENVSFQKGTSDIY